MSWTCTVRRGSPPMVYVFPEKKTNMDLAVCNYNKNDKGEYEPEELDLFAYGMVNYGITYRLSLDLLENAEVYKPLCFKNNSNIRRDPSYWAETYRSKVSRDLDEVDQDIWVDLHYHGTKQEEILQKSLRK